jgi:hypothetical protein
MLPLLMEMLDLELISPAEFNEAAAYSNPQHLGLMPDRLLERLINAESLILLNPEEETMH